MLRRMATGWLDGQMSLPAGTLEPGETLRQAAAREVKEEVGVEVLLSDLRYAHTVHSSTGGQDWTGHFFVTDLWSGEPRICEAGKHSDLRWENFDGLPADTVPYVHQALTAISQSEPYSEFGWRTMTADA
jgi:8-oxo-dGTP diphosphatase